MHRHTSFTSLLLFLLATAAVAFPPIGQVGPGIFRHSNQDGCDPPPDDLPIIAGDFVAEAYRTTRTIHVNINATGLDTGLCWQDAFTDLQDALDLARSLPHADVQIWVASGVYRPDRGTGDRTMSFELVDGVGVFGGFNGTENRRFQRNRDPVTNATILSGDLLTDDASGNKNDNAYHVVRGENLSRSTVLDGFQIIGGLADGVNGDADSFNGGGLFLRNASPTVRWILFFDNLAFSGGAVYVERGQPLLRYVGYLQNAALNGGAAYLTVNGVATFEYNNVWDNFSVEDGGGFYITNTAGATISHTRFLNNDARDGGGVFMNNNASMLAVSSIFSGNTATLGTGGIGTVGPTTTDLINATIASNSGALGGGVLTDGGGIDIKNSILWGNTASGQLTDRAQFNPVPGTTWGMSYTCMENWTLSFGGTQMTAADPLFVDNNGQLGTNLKLQPGSPLIDAGNNTPLIDDGEDSVGRGIGLPLHQQVDVDELPRFVDDPLTSNTGNGAGGDPIVDIGASEYQPEDAEPIDP